MHGQRPPAALRRFLSACVLLAIALGSLLWLPSRGVPYLSITGLRIVGWLLLPLAIVQLMRSLIGSPMFYTSRIGPKR